MRHPTATGLNPSHVAVTSTTTLYSCQLAIAIVEAIILIIKHQNMSFGFGVGVGDCFTVATLAWRISIALRGRDRSEGVKLLISELEFTAQTLYQSGTLLDNINCHNVDNATRHVVGLGLSRCKEELMKLDKIVKKYQRGSRPSKPIYLRWILVPGQNLQWEFSAKDGLKQLRDNISKSLIQMNHILAVSKL